MAEWRHRLSGVRPDDQTAIGHMQDDIERLLAAVAYLHNAKAPSSS